jgi:hypothetical protein
MELAARLDQVMFDLVDLEKKWLPENTLEIYIESVSCVSFLVRNLVNPRFLCSVLLVILNLVFPDF